MRKSIKKIYVSMLTLMIAAAMDVYAVQETRMYQSVPYTVMSECYSTYASGFVKRENTDTVSISVNFCYRSMDGLDRIASTMKFDGTRVVSASTTPVNASSVKAALYSYTIPYIKGNASTYLYDYY